MWADIDDVIIKTLISAHSILKHNYRTCFPNHVKGSACFEILGFDVLLDRKLRPQVLEVGRTFMHSYSLFVLCRQQYFHCCVLTRHLKKFLILANMFELEHIKKMSTPVCRNYAEFKY